MHWEAADREIVHFCMSDWGMLTLCRFYRLQCTLVRSDESRASCTEFGERRRATTQRSIPTVKHSGGSMFWWHFSVWESHRGGRNDEDRRKCDRSGEQWELQQTTAGCYPANGTHRWPLASGKLISFCEIILFLRAKSNNVSKQNKTGMFGKDVLKIPRSD